MKNQKSKIKNFQKGFTLIEALVAISILMIAIASPLTLAQKGISTAELSRDQMTASFLAQDGMEAIKNMRDQTALNSSTSLNNWLTGFDNCRCLNDSSCSAFTQYCSIDTTLPNLSISSSHINPLKITYSNGAFLKYDLSGASTSIFSRFVNIATTTMPGEAVIRVRVQWTSQSGIQNVDLKDFIYNYSNNPYVTN